MRFPPAAGPLVGRCQVPGDKSIGHRALLFGAIAEGESHLRGLSSGEDNLSTRRCLEALGVSLRSDATGLTVRGQGLRGLRAPAGPLDCGNSGTTARLMAGLVAGAGLRARFVGDASLSGRPMGRVAAPLRAMGAQVEGREEGGRLYLPLEVAGGALEGLRYESPVASAQVKSCVLLAGLGAAGPTELIEPAPSRDHTERMLAAMGAPLEAGPGWARVQPLRHPLRPLELEIPGDPSSAAFLAVAAALVPGSALRVEGVCLNPTRDAFIDVLSEMGAQIARRDLGEQAGEPVGALEVEGGVPLRGVRVEGPRVPSLIDEIPILAVAAAAAEGETVFEGVGELRVKESDRIAAVCALLAGLGVEVEAWETGFRVVGQGPNARLHAAAPFNPAGDHRLAMSAAVAALITGEGVEVEDFACSAVSFPGFDQVLAGLQRTPR